MGIWSPSWFQRAIRTRDNAAICQTCVSREAGTGPCRVAFIAAWTLLVRRALQVVHARLTDGLVAAGPAITAPDAETSWVPTASLTVDDQVEP